MEAVAELIQERSACRVVDLARRFGVSHVTVNRIVRRLHNEGLLIAEPYQPVLLTAKGRRLAEKSRERHQIVCDFLLAIGLDAATAALDAEGMEHHISPKTLLRFKALTEQLASANNAKR